jgi:16S rRNA (guanine1207-N2)-methyltransferase
LTEQIVTSIRNVQLRFETNPRLFSPRKVDAGTLAMLSVAEFEPRDKVLDLGCGYGVVGVFAAKQTSPQRVFLIDNDPVAVRCASANARLNEVGGVTVVCSDGFRDFRETGFTKMLCNPPYHADFEVAKHFIQKGFNRLELGGTLYMVTKREAWYRNKLHAIFGVVRVHTLGSYFVFEATKIAATYANARRV